MNDPSQRLAASNTVVELIKMSSFLRLPMFMLLFILMVSDYFYANPQTKGSVVLLTSSRGS